MTASHTIATAVITLGAIGTVAMLGYRAALHCVDLRVIPAHLATRAHWWNNRVSPVLHASLLLTATGIVGLLTA
jgi:hypothetical protein